MLSNQQVTVIDKNIYQIRFTYNSFMITFEV